MEANYELLNETQLESEEDSFTEDRYRQFYRFLPSGARSVLDIGCNTGKGGSALKAAGPHLSLHGLDAVKDRIDRLPPSIYANGIHGSATAIPWSDNTFDAIVSGEFIEHLYAADVDRTLHEMFRSLRLRGRALLTTPNPGSLKLKMKGLSVLNDWHVSQHFPSVLKLRMQMAGFSRVRILGSGKASRYLGAYAPLFAYGSFLIMGDKF